MNIYQFAIMLVALLFGGHSALHRWDLRTTRRGMLRRACLAPEVVARAWVELQDGGQAPKLWLQFSGGLPHMVAQGHAACEEVVARLRAAGVTVDDCALPLNAPQVGGAEEAAR